ncbi:helix-turn-helix domain-containing protein [Mammaliicoccus vitulinus]|uniref:helix-turn-helix domain-containing protein n=1 Tax=Mammaliicoccus vitulinus TaxID=71237 RepID=UPI003B9E01DB
MFSSSMKKLRKQKGLTLEALSVKSKVSKSMLSKIERNEKQPTVKIASQIAEALDTSISDLIDEKMEKEIILIKKDNQLEFKDPVSKFTRRLLSPSLPSKNLEFILNTIPPNEESGIFPSHKKGVSEYIYVQEGELEIHLDNNQIYTLCEGDSIYYEANLSHRFINKTGNVCSYFLIIDSSQIKN